MYGGEPKKAKPKQKMWRKKSQQNGGDEETPCYGVAASPIEQMETWPDKSDGLEIFMYGGSNRKTEQDIDNEKHDGMLEHVGDCCCVCQVRNTCQTYYEDVL